MKIRYGFVSNSSSASYIITLSGDMKDINQLIVESIQFVGWNNELEERLNEDVTRLKKSITRLEQGKESFLDRPIEEQKSRLAQAIADLETITTNRDKTELVDYANLVLRNYDINRIDMYNGDVKLSASTSMHNCYTEGLPRIMHEIVLQQVFEKPNVKIMCEIDRDNS